MIWHGSSHISFIEATIPQWVGPIGTMSRVEGPLAHPWRPSPILPIAPELRIHRAQASDATIRRNQPHLRRRQPWFEFPMFHHKKKYEMKIDRTRVTKSNNATIMWTSKVWQMSAA